MSKSDSKIKSVDGIPLLLFAKAPIAGKVKTRLQSHCSPEQSADIAEILLEASLQSACQHWRGPVYLSTWLDRQHPTLLKLSERFKVPILNQCDGNLGRKMLHSFETHGYPMAIMGCDAPHTSRDTLNAMYEHLLKGRSAIGPSLDGGYYIIGLSESAPYLFEGLPWGSDTVLALTHKKSESENLVLEELNSLQDVDEWPHVLEVSGQLPSLAAYLKKQSLA